MTGFKNKKGIIAAALTLISVLLLFPGWITVKKEIRRVSFLGFSAEDLTETLSDYSDYLMDELEDLDIPSSKLASLQKEVRKTARCVKDMKLSPKEMATIGNGVGKIIKTVKKYDDGWLIDDDTYETLSKINLGIFSYNALFFITLLLGILTIVFSLFGKNGGIGTAYFVLLCILIIVVVAAVPISNNLSEDELGISILAVTLWPFISLLLALPLWPRVIADTIGDNAPSVGKRKAAAVCSSCGAPMKAGFTFCSMCGAPQVKARPEARICPRCGRQLKPEWAFCPICGPVSQSRPASWRCPNCGTENAPDNAFCYSCGQRRV